MPGTDKHYDAEYRKRPKDSDIMKYPYWMEVLENMTDKISRAHIYKDYQYKTKNDYKASKNYTP